MHDPGPGYFVRTMKSVNTGPTLCAVSLNVVIDIGLNVMRSYNDPT